MRKLTFLVPIADNDGRPFTPQDWAWLEDELLDLAGGWTLEGEVHGVWRGEDGTIYRDISRRYSIAVTDLGDARGLMEGVKRRFRQEALYTEEPEVRVNII